MAVSGLRVALLLVVWLAGFALTPGLLEHGPGSMLFGDDAAIILAETLLAGALLTALLLTARTFRRRMLRRSWRSWFWMLPAVLALVLPLHYGLPLPVGVYLVWITVSVPWQDVLTFGLLQSALETRLSRWVSVAVVAGAFAAAHALLLPARFAPPAVLPLLGILLLGAALASLRSRTGDLHILMSLHLAFYFVFA